MNNPIYVYDNRKEFQEPIFVAYDEKNVDKIIIALFGEVPSWVFVSKARLHKYNAQSETYLGKFTARK